MRSRQAAVRAAPVHPARTGWPTRRRPAGRGSGSSIFIASSVSSTSPARTCCPTPTATSITVAGIGAARSRLAPRAFAARGPGLRAATSRQAADPVRADPARVRRSGHRDAPRVAAPLATTYSPGRCAPSRRTSSPALRRGRRPSAQHLDRRRAVALPHDEPTRACHVSPSIPAARSTGRWRSGCPSAAPARRAASTWATAAASAAAGSGPARARSRARSPSRYGRVDRAGPERRAVEHGAAGTGCWSAGRGCGTQRAPRAGDRWRRRASRRARSPSRSSGS